MATRKRFGDPERQKQLQETYDKLKKVRASKTVTLKPSKFMRSRYTSYDGTENDFKLRYYQVQGAYHLLVMKRMILGDDTGLGKTIEAISAFAHMLERDPKAKVVIVTPKSTVRQWATEIKRFTTNIRPIVIETVAAAKNDGVTPLEQRKALYREWANAPTGPDDERVVLIVNYALLIRDWNAEGFRPVKPNGKPDPKKPVVPGVLDKVIQDVSDGGPRLITFLDECFDYDTPVHLGDGSLAPIGRIVCNRHQHEVLSWNWQTQQVEAKAILNWWRTPLSSWNRHMIKVRSKFGGVCRVTSNHNFYTASGGKVAAAKLQPGTKIAYLDKRAPSEGQLQIILGGLLGDASIKCPKNNLWGVVFVQGVKQAKYLEFKRESLAALGVSATTKSKSGYTGVNSIVRFTLHGIPYLCANFNFHDGERKRVTIEWLSAIGPLGLAIWYGDDGSIKVDQSGKYSISLHTQGFTESECNLLSAWLLWKWGVKARVGPTSKGFVLYMGYEASEAFMGLLPGALPGVEYKFPGKAVLSSVAAFPCPRIITDQVLSSEPWIRSARKTRRPCQEYVYDLEVADNHNYFVGKGMLVSNCQAFRNTRTKTWEIVRYLCDRAERAYGLTATPLTSNLMEGYCLYKAIKPELFSTKTKFLESYCHTKLQDVPGTKRKIPIVVGYHDLDRFRARIDPFYLGRKKQDVSDELPVLVSKDIVCELSAAEDRKYAEALSGIFELGNGEIKDFEENRALVSLIYCQQVVDSLSMLKFDEGAEVGVEFDIETLDMTSLKVGALGAKEEALAGLVGADGELQGEKVIVYTRFASLVPRLQKILERDKIHSVRITGKENDKKRAAAQEAFQDAESNVKVIFITDAGGVGINLQMARALVFYDLPWTWGAYIQTLGRMIRIGSPHKGVVVYHLMAERVGTRQRRTIDHHVYKLLKAKKELIDKVLGEAAVGALDFKKGSNNILELVRSLQTDGVEGSRAA
jgi:superfamily II DNA or RNA helicase